MFPKLSSLTPSQAKHWRQGLTVNFVAFAFLTAAAWPVLFSLAMLGPTAVYAQDAETSAPAPRSLRGMRDIRDLPPQLQNQMQGQIQFQGQQFQGQNFPVNVQNAGAAPAPAASPASPLQPGSEARVLTPKTHRSYKTASATTASANNASKSGSSKLSKKSAASGVLLNFQNAEIEAVAQAMASLTQRNIVIDPRVRGTMSLASERSLSTTQALQQFTTALRLQGFALVESGGLLKIVPESEAKLQSGQVITASGQDDGAQALMNAKAGQGKLLTQIFKLTHEAAGNLVPVLRPLISANNTINVSAGNNSLIVTDYADNLQRLAQIIAALDVPAATDLELIPLQHASASDVVPLLNRLLDTTGSAPTGQPVVVEGGSAVRHTILAEPRSNSVMVRAANAARLAQIRSLVAKLDIPNGSAGTNSAAGANSARNPAMGNIYVVHLKNADATKLAATLRNLTSSGGNSITAPAPAAGGASGAGAASAAASAGGPSSIQADTSSNSLIFTATPPQYVQLKAVIDRLDTRRAQVFVESLIAEVNADKAAEIGIQWQTPVGSRGDSTVGILGTNYGTVGNIVNLALAGQNASAANAGTLLGQGLNIGIGQQVAGRYVLSLLGRFLEQNGDGNVLSTPNLLTLDNEEAKIVIGQNVPFITGQYTNTGASSGGSGVNPFQTIERKDIGLMLKVKPQISENGTIKMAIEQEVSSISATSAAGLITNKRAIQSNVLVEDGSIVVLGGLLQDEQTDTENKIPLLGDIPFIGHLFKSTNKARKKTNLMVFLRPVVVRDGAATEALSLDRYEQLRGAANANQNRNGAVPSNFIPELQPLLPALDRTLRLPIEK